MLSGQIHLPDGWFAVLDGVIRGTEFRFHVLDANGKRRQVSGHTFDDRLEGALEMQDGSLVELDGSPVNYPKILSSADGP